MKQQEIKAIIIDDETDGRNMLALLLSKFFPDIRLAGIATDVASAIHLIRQEEPDLIFLDVEMPDGNAFDVMSACEGFLKHVILVTAHENYAIKGIKASVLDYLLKPVNKEEFIKAVNKALSLKNNTANAEQPISLLNIYQHLIIRKIHIPTLDGFSVADIENIVRCEASGNYTIINFAGNKKITACRTLGEYEKELKDYGFIRIHHRHLININYVVEYHKGKSGGGYVTLKDNESVEVSTRKKTDLLNALH